MKKLLLIVSVLLTMFITNIACAEDYLHRGTDEEYLGFQISSTQFKTCDGVIFNLQKTDKISHARERCDVSSSVSSSSSDSTDTWANVVMFLGLLIFLAIMFR